MVTATRVLVTFCDIWILFYLLRRNIMVWKDTRALKTVLLSWVLDMGLEREVLTERDMRCVS